jgi:hydroxymethylpyrimidine pyrophosphatase-like HAD family hydrolase
MAIGDQGNDLTMIDFAGTGVAMGNAIDEVKQHANEITLPNSQDGVAAAIKKWVLN